LTPNITPCVPPVIITIIIYVTHTHTHIHTLLGLQGVQCLAYGPLGGPNAYLPNDLLPHPVVSKVAEECGKSNGQVLVKWSVQRGVPVLVKTGTASRLKENLWGMMDYKLSDAQMVGCCCDFCCFYIYIYIYIIGCAGDLLLNPYLCFA
jgi:2,5-diketo-D-gluconate reductase A